MDYRKKIIYRSNGWYNEGLRRARRRDISGAIEALRTSLRYCSDNIAARNLLGLCYYGIGEVTEALIQWIISKNMRPQGNIAVRYIDRVQREPKKLEEKNLAVKRYNQCLEQCRNRDVDMAILQLRKAVAAHPSFLRAYQLLALLYIQSGKYAAADDTLRIALRLDRANKQTLRYIKELPRLTKGKRNSMSAGETQAFRPVREKSQASRMTLRDVSRHFGLLNFIGGVVAGTILVGGLLIPHVIHSQKEKAQDDSRQYSERISALTAQSDALQKTLDGYRSGDRAVDSDVAAGYDSLLNAIQQHDSGNYTPESVADALIAVERSSLGEWGQQAYDRLSEEVYPQVTPVLYERGKSAYEQQNYKEAVLSLGKVARIDETFDNGNALLMLGESCIREQDTAQAKRWLDKVVQQFAATEQAKRAQTLLAALQEQEQKKSQQDAGHTQESSEADTQAHEDGVADDGAASADEAQ